MIDDENSNLSVIEIESQNESQDQGLISLFDSRKLRPGGLKRAQEGVTYQQALLNLIAVNSYNAFKKAFVLLSEEESCAKFDDIILELQDCIFFHQVKHSQKEIPFSVRDLFTSGRKVRLLDYFIPFVNINEKFGDKTLFFIFLFNSGFDSEFFNCTEVANLLLNEQIFQSFKGETRKFDFEKSIGSKEIKKQLVETLIPIATMELLRKKVLIEIELPDINQDPGIREFIKILSQILNECCTKLSNIIEMNDFKAFLRPLFLCILDLDDEELNKDEIKLQFAAGFILNNNLTGLSKKIRNELVFEKGDDHLKVVLQTTSVKCPKSLFILETTVDPEAKKKKEFFFKEMTEENPQRIICSFGSQKDQFLLMSIFRSEKESGPLIFEHENYESDFKTTIYNKFCSIFTKRVNPNADQELNSQEKEESLELISRFLDALYFKIDQPTKDELNKLSHEKFKQLSELGSREINERMFRLISDWLASPLTTRLNGQEYHELFQINKINEKRFELLRDTLPFMEYCKERFRFLQFSPLDPECALKKFLMSENTTSHFFILSEEGRGRSQLYARQVISSIHGEKQKDGWGFIDIRVNHFKCLPTILRSIDLQHIIIDISIELNDNKFELLEKVLSIALAEKKKIVLLNTHIQSDIQTQNLKLLKIIAPQFTDEEVITQLNPEQIEAACENYKEKAIFLAGKYHQLQNILKNPDCGLYNILSHPEYLYEVLKDCKNIKANHTKTEDDLYICNEIVGLVPRYSLKMILKESSAKIIWLENSSKDLLNFIKKWFQDPIKDQESSKKNKKKFFVFRDIDSIEKLYNRLPTNKAKAIITGTIRQDIYRKIKGRILHVHCHPNKRSGKRASIEMFSNYQVEIAEENVLTKFIKPVSFDKTFQENKVQILTHDKLLKISSGCKSGTITWIRADAGMGKTCLLQELRKRWQSSETDLFYHWIFMIDLTKIDYKNLTTFEDFLVDLPVIEKKSAWVRKAFEHDKMNEKILLLLDAWDEVKPAMHDQVKKFISIIPSSVDCIIVTRPHRLNSMDLSRWNNCYFTLKPFNEELINEYILRFLHKEKNLRTLEIAVASIQANIWKWIKTLGEKFLPILGVPLQISQICQIFSKVSNLGQTHDEDNQSLNIAKLYDHFIETVFYKLHLINSEEHEVLHDCWRVYFAFLSNQAYQQLFDKSQDYFENHHSFEKLSEGSVKQLLQTGLIKSLNDDKSVEFAHQTYKEYFGAFYLFRILCGKRESDDLYNEVLRDISKNKYIEYYQMVFIFAFQFCINGHSQFHQMEKEVLVPKFLNFLNSSQRDVIGRANKKLFSACLRPLTAEQREKILCLLPKEYRSLTLQSEKDSKILIPTSVWLKDVPIFGWDLTSCLEEIVEKLEDNKIIQHLVDKSCVLKYTEKFIERHPNNKKQLADCFKKILGEDLKGKDLDWFWDLDGGFEAMALLADDFDQHHAIYFKNRILMDPSRRIEPAISALLELERISSNKEILKEITLVFLMIFGKYGRKVLNILELILTYMQPLRLIQALVDIGLFDRALLNNSSPFELQDPLSFIFAIAYIAEYAVINEEELTIDTGRKRLSLSRGPLTHYQKKYISKILENYNPGTCTYIYFIKKELKLQEMSRENFLSMAAFEKQNILSHYFLDGKEANETVTWLRDQKLLGEDISDALAKIASEHTERYDNWARDGGWCAIVKMGEYFNNHFSEFLVRRGRLWPSNIPDILSNLKILDDDLQRIQRENQNNNLARNAWDHFKQCQKKLIEKYQEFKSRIEKEDSNYK